MSRCFSALEASDQSIASGLIDTIVMRYVAEFGDQVAKVRGDRERISTKGAFVRRSGVISGAHSVERTIADGFDILHQPHKISRQCCELWRSHLKGY